MQSEIAPSHDAEVTAADAAEAQLAKDIGDLWAVHAQSQSLLGKTRDELKIVRANLAERLYELKSVLSCPGRSGQWSGFLASEKIPRTTADRLVSLHEKSINVDGNRTDGATKKLSDDGIAQVAKAT